MPEVPLQLQPDEIRSVASHLNRLSRDTGQMQSQLCRAWARLDAGWDGYAESGIGDHYNQATGEIAAMNAMLAQMSRALAVTADLIEAADRSAVGLFGESLSLIAVQADGRGGGPGTGDEEPLKCPPGFPALIWQYLSAEARAWVVQNLVYYVIVKNEEGGPSILNLRQTPTADGAWITAIPYGAALLWYGEVSPGQEAASGDKWYKVIYVDAEGQVHTGWVAAEYGNEAYLSNQEALINEKVAPHGVVFVGTELASPQIVNQFDPETGEYVPVDPGENASQIIGTAYGEDGRGPLWPRLVNEKGEELSSHGGLCGQASVAAILNAIFAVSVNQITDVFVTSVRSDQAPDYTRGDELEALINDVYGGLLQAEFVIEANEDGFENMPAVMGEWLGNGDYVIAGVGIDGSTGQLTTSGTGHWVVVTGVGTDAQTDTDWVRIYNPYDNETEYYTWENFRESWWGNYSMSGYHYLRVENVVSPYPNISYPPR